MSFFVFCLRLKAGRLPKGVPRNCLFSVDFLKYTFCVLCMQEIDLKKNMDEKELEISKYLLEVEDNHTKARVGMYISKNLQYKRQRMLEGTDSNLQVVDIGKEFPLRPIMNFVFDNERLNKVVSTICSSVIFESIYYCGDCYTVHSICSVTSWLFKNILVEI